MLKIDTKTAQFFMAIGKSGVHSFVFFGIYQGNEIKHILARSGKYAFNGGNNCSMAAQMLFSTVPSRLKNEKIGYENPKSIPVSYQAYDISYQQYLEYLNIIENLQTEQNQFNCFKPFSKIGIYTVFSKMTKPYKRDGEVSAKSVQAASQIKASFSSLSVGNTCRHSAINMVEAITGNPISEEVSSTYFRDLPCQTILDLTQPKLDEESLLQGSKTPAKNIGAFYVLPRPPMKGEILGVQYDLALKLYQRLEKLVELEPDSAVTQEKFRVMKAFYNDNVLQKDLSLKELLEHLIEWKTENKACLTQLRERFFWDDIFTREAATWSMAEEMEKTLKNNIPT